MNDKDKSVGIKLDSVHEGCGHKQLIDYIGYVWCNHCEEIVDPNDILTEEEFLALISEKANKYK